MSGLSGRNPGVIGAVLNSDCYFGMIVDLLHVHKGNVQLVVNLKPDKAYLVTDAVTPTGTEMVEFHLSDKKLFVKNGKCQDENGTLAGAYLTMNEAVRNCYK